MTSPYHPNGHQAQPENSQWPRLAQALQPAGLGALVLLSFLFLVSFSGRFPMLGGVQRAMYVTAAVLSALAAIVLLAPAACQRLSGSHPREQMALAAGRMVAGGLAAEGLAMAAAVRLAARWAEPRIAADLTGAGTAALFITLWLVLPRLLSHRSSPAATPPRSLPPPRSH